MSFVSAPGGDVTLLGGGLHSPNAERRRVERRSEM